MKYEKPQLSVVCFASDDVIKTSGGIIIPGDGGGKPSGGIKDFEDPNVDENGWL